MIWKNRTLVIVTTIRNNHITAPTHERKRNNLRNNDIINLNCEKDLTYKHTLSWSQSYVNKNSKKKKKKKKKKKNIYTYKKKKNLKKKFSGLNRKPKKKKKIGGENGKIQIKLSRRFQLFETHGQTFLTISTNFTFIEAFA